MICVLFFVRCSSFFFSSDDGGIYAFEKSFVSSVLDRVFRC